VLKETDMTDLEGISRDRRAGDQDSHHSRAVGVDQEVVVHKNPKDRQDHE
jgi:hypothetical protein